MFIQNVDEKGVPAGYEMFTSQVIFPAETDQVTTMLSNLHHSCPYIFNFNFNYSIPFSIFHNTTKRMELFSLKGTTVLSSDWFIGLTITVIINYPGMTELFFLE
jgi:hypothetical protein